ncbi:MAG: hypothetical protein ACLPXW_01575 [Xanthobacteraceae bacterium]
MLEVNKNAKLNFAMTTMVLPLLYAFKNPAFREEKEWRAGKFVAMIRLMDEVREEDEWGAWALRNMDYHAMDDRIIPHRPVPLENQESAIREIILGPRNITPVLIVQECLRRHGWTDVAIRRSLASYR